jgi:hypothetical protein
MNSHQMLIAACGLVLTSFTSAAGHADPWEARASVYGYFPSTAGTSRFPTPAGDELEIDADELVERTDAAIMAAFELRRGRWGAFTDLIYLDARDSIEEASALGLGSVPLPPGVTADAALDVEAWIWTLAASMRVVSSEHTTLDIFAGARLLDVESSLRASLATPLGSVPLVSGSLARDSWNGIVGLKGRYSFGSHGQWFLPFELDVGAGDADLIAQAAAGFGYTAGQTEFFATYRYLGFDFGPEAAARDLDFRGPAVGVSYRF